MSLALHTNNINFDFDYSEREESKYSHPFQPKIAEDITEALGIVPTIRIKRFAKICEDHQMYMKLEACNPGGSVKEKNAAYLIRDAERKGFLKEGGTIIESSSGNFGIGLAMVGSALGYRVIIVVDAKTPPPTRRILNAYGADLIDVPLELADEHGSMQVPRMKKAQDLANEIKGAWYPCQHLNPVNPEAHSHYTAQEIAASFGKDVPDFLVVGVSTAGQIAGISKYFDFYYPRVRIIGVDVAGSAIFGTPRHPYKMTGLGLSFVPPNFSKRCLSEAYIVGDELAFSVTRLLAKKEGLLLGASTGAILATGLSLAYQQRSSKRILMVNPDRGDRYLETVYNDTWMENQKLKILAEQEILDQCKNLQSVEISSEVVKNA